MEMGNWNSSTGYNRVGHNSGSCDTACVGI